MRHISIFATAFMILVSQSAIAPAFTDNTSMTDRQVKRLLIKSSRDGYSGNCACPEDRDSRGRRCGRRSAYSKPGGAEPLCYERDVTPEMIHDFRSR